MKIKKTASQLNKVEKTLLTVGQLKDAGKTSENRIKFMYLCISNKLVINTALKPVRDESEGVSKILSEDTTVQEYEAAKKELIAGYYLKDAEGKLILEKGEPQIPTEIFEEAKNAVAKFEEKYPEILTKYKEVNKLQREISEKELEVSLKPIPQNLLPSEMDAEQLTILMEAGIVK